MPNPTLVSMLASCFLAGGLSTEEIVAQSARVLGKNWPWLGPLAKRYLRFAEHEVRPRHREVVKFLLGDSGFRRQWSKLSGELPVKFWLVEPQRMQPLGPAATWNLPPFESARELSDWLDVSISELEWFADLKGLCYKANSQKLSHYHYRVLAKDSGSIRLIEAPKPRLKKIQRKLLEGILVRIPPHPAAHGFVRGRSIKTFVSPHVRKHVVVRMDLRDFFPSLTRARIQACFRTLGYPEIVADLLGGICTNAAPRDLWKAPATDINHHYFRSARLLYSQPHLPQGAPTSPALANICAYRIDSRLAGLSKTSGVAYTRYADDLAFSGDEQFEKGTERFSIQVASILMQERFSVNHRKTRIMRQGVGQYLAGLAINHHPNMIGSDFDRLKAILTNCIRSGPKSQNHEGRFNFQEYLKGRVGFVEMVNPKRGQRLRQLYDEIRWD